MLLNCFSFAFVPPAAPPPTRYHMCPHTGSTNPTNSHLFTIVTAVECWIFLPTQLLPKLCLNMSSPNLAHEQLLLWEGFMSISTGIITENQDIGKGEKFQDSLQLYPHPRHWPTLHCSMPTSLPNLPPISPFSSPFFQDNDSCHQVPYRAKTVPDVESQTPRDPFTAGRPHVGSLFYWWQTLCVT